jgi:ferredoxin--NADP+ reductase
VIPNDAGRVVDPDSGEQVAGHYAVGWIKRGPSGVIGTNKKDALDTVNSIFEDLEAGRIPELEPVAVPIAELLDDRGGDHVTYMGWQAIDRAEQAAGEPHGRPRVKFCRVHEMVEAAREAAAAS